MEKEEQSLSCVQCGTLNCHKHESHYPKFCLTTNMDETMLEASLAHYQEEGIDRTIALSAAEIEGKYYGTLTRVEEILAFARRIGAKKVGIASCVGLAGESKTFAKILEVHGFTPIMAICKVGSRDKTEIGLQEAQKIRPETFEPRAIPSCKPSTSTPPKPNLTSSWGCAWGMIHSLSNTPRPPRRTLWSKTAY